MTLVIEESSVKCLPLSTVKILKCEYSDRLWQEHNCKCCQIIASLINDTFSIDIFLYHGETDQSVCCDVMGVTQFNSLVDGHGCRASVTHLANIENGKLGISFKFQFFRRSEKVAVKIRALRFF
jgi:hypothetical protein